MEILYNVVIDRWMGPKPDVTQSFHIYVLTADNVERDLVIYNYAKVIQQLQLRELDIPRHVYSADRYNQLVSSSVSEECLLDIHVWNNYIVQAIWPAGRLHMAAFSIQRRWRRYNHRRRYMAAFTIQIYWRRATTDPKFEICRKLQIDRIGF